MSGTTVGWWVLVGLGVATWFACCGWIVFDWRRQKRRAADEGLTLHGPVHQIYLSAVDTIGTDRQRSIVRVPVAPPQAA